MKIPKIYGIKSKICNMNVIFEKKKYSQININNNVFINQMVKVLFFKIIYNFANFLGNSQFDIIFKLF